MNAERAGDRAARGASGAAARRVQPHVPVDRDPPPPAQPAHRGRDPGRAGRRCSCSSARTSGSRGSDGVGLTAATTMIGIAVYGAMLAATSGGAMVSIERAQGWSRQLRLTPLRPAAYIAIKLVVAMLLGLTSVVVVYVVRRHRRRADDARDAGSLTGVLAWAASLVFAAFGLFMGYLLPSENVMQVDRAGAGRSSPCSAASSCR